MNSILSNYEILQKNLKKEFTLDNDSKKKITNFNDFMSIVSSIFEQINPIFSTLPLFCYVINLVIGYTSEDNIIYRIKKFEKKLSAKKISLNKFKNKIMELSEHNEYVVRKHLINVILNAVPETVSIYIEVIIDLIMKKESSKYEELCDILYNLNVNDIKLLQMIKKYEKNGVKTKYNNYYIKLADEKSTNNKKQRTKGTIVFEDRNLFLKNKTIFWEDFSETYDLYSPEMGFPLLIETKDENNGKKSIKWAFLIRAFIKLEKLGVLQMDYITTIGTINSLNVERFP